MKITNETDVGVRGLVYLASRPSRAATDLKDVAASSGVPRATLARVFGKLAEAGVIKDAGSSRYSLAYPADQISLRMILEAVEGPESLKITLGTRAKDGSRGRRRSAHPAWQEVEKLLADSLEEYTLECFCLDAQYYL
jgi:Rrf2 family protein